MRPLFHVPVSASFLLGVALIAATGVAHGSDRHPRKYKAPPPLAHVEVTVLKGSTGKPLYNAAVVFHPMKQDKDEGNMELKTNEEGKAVLDMLPIGSDVMVQVIMKGYRTYGREYSVTTDKKFITIELLPPDQQYSIYKQKSSSTDAQNNAPQTQMGHAAPADSPLLAPAPEKKSHPY